MCVKSNWTYTRQYSVFEEFFFAPVVKYKKKAIGMRFVGLYLKI